MNLIFYWLHFYFFICLSLLLNYRSRLLYIFLLLWRTTCFSLLLLCNFSNVPIWFLLLFKIIIVLYFVDVKLILCLRLLWGLFKVWFFELVDNFLIWRVVSFNNLDMNRRAPIYLREFLSTLMSPIEFLVVS